MKKRRSSLSKSRIRSSINNRRRVQKKNTASTITSRHNIFRLRMTEEFSQQPD